MAVPQRVDRRPRHLHHGQAREADAVAAGFDQEAHGRRAHEVVQRDAEGLGDGEEQIQARLALAALQPKLITAEYRVEKRPPDRVLVDYNQNAWGRTLASVYSVRPHPQAAVSTPVTWAEIERGRRIEDFRLDNVPARVKARICASFSPPDPSQTRSRWST